MKYLKYIFLVIYIFITLFIFIKSFENSEQSSNTSDQVTDVIVGTIDGITPGDESITDKFDINDIKIFVRKAIGHFGIFLLLGIFSCLTYYYFINKKLISMIIIIVTGFDSLFIGLVYCWFFKILSNLLYSLECRSILETVLELHPINVLKIINNTK